MGVAMMAWAGQATAYTFECPKQLLVYKSTDPVVLYDRHPDVYGDFLRLGVFDGHPEKEVELVPDNPDAELQRWTLNGDGFWVACFYEHAGWPTHHKLPKVEQCSTPIDGRFLTCDQ